MAKKSKVRKNGNGVMETSNSFNPKSKSSKFTSKKLAESRAKNSGKEPFLIAIGASAGGLEALRGLISHVASLPHASMVVVQHLSPQHRSMLVDLIGRETKLVVREVKHGDKPQPNMVYITPPNADIVYSGGALKLTKPKSKIGPKPSVDLFFESVADNFGDRAVGIILSGTGSDGTHGIRCIKAAGGLTMVQSPDSAKFDGMPVSAISSGVIDIIGTPEFLAEEVSRLEELAQKEKAIAEGTLDHYKDILGRIKTDYDVDFSVYKPNTIRRRLHRRMLANRVDSVESYRAFIDRNPKEVGSLFQDILISVTSFFRDASAFKELEKCLRKQIKAKSYLNNTYRVWIPGCATGEEAYTIAMLLSEIVPQDEKIKIQIFGTDLSETALAVARRGFYAEALLAKVPERFKNLYFNQVEGGYQVKKYVRDMVVFAKQNLLKDPPFLKLDLISCRNVFIYFNQDVQDRVFQTFHYALNPQGLMFLGKSETTGRNETLFKPISSRSRVYSRAKGSSSSPGLMRRMETDALIKPSKSKSHPTLDPKSVERVIANIAANSVLIDEAFNIKKVYGSMSSLLKIGEGDLSTSLLRYINNDLKSEVTTLVHKAKKEKKRIIGRTKVAVVDSKTREIQLGVIPIKFDGLTEYLVEVLQDTPVDSAKKQKSKANAKFSDDHVRELEQELAATKEHLQTVIEELETSNEELQALNEELQSANEELQSANEELETSNEELHATNEELTTLNEEINAKSAETAALNDYLETIQNAVSFPLFVVDHNMNVVRHNEACNEIFRTNPSVIGKNVRLIQTHYSLKAAFDDIEQTILDQTEREAQIETQDRIFELRTRPLQSLRGDLHGAVVTMSDITEHVRAFRRVSETEQTLQSILRNTPAIVSLKDAAGRYEFVNEKFTEITGFKSSQVIGRTDEEVFDIQTAKRIRQRDFEALQKREAITFEETFGKDGSIHLFTAKVPLLDSKASPRSVCTMSLDITERHAAEEMIKAQQEQIIRVGKLSALGEMAAGIAHELNTPLNAIQANVDVLEALADSGDLKKDEILGSGREIQKLVMNISNIITGLRGIARMESTGFEIKDVRDLVRETAQICSLNLRNHGVRLELKLPPYPVEIECQPVQLCQVIINLINNAVDAIDGNPDKWVCIELKDGVGSVEVSVTDCGKGIPKEVADKIMTPFFTTKEKGRGTGMGLSLSQSIINIHSGNLFLDPSAENTTFRAILPKRQVKNERSSRTN